MRLEEALAISRVIQKLDGSNQGCAAIPYYLRHTQRIPWTDTPLDYTHDRLIVALVTDSSLTFTLVWRDTLRPICRNLQAMSIEPPIIHGRDDWEPITDPNIHNIQY